MQNHVKSRRSNISCLLPSKSLYEGTITAKQ